MKMRAIRQQAMVQAAFSLFAERGYEKTTMQQIADQAEIGVATLFRYFPTKERLLVAATKQVIEQQLPAFEAILHQKNRGIDKLDGVLSNYILYLSDNNNEATKLLESFELYMAYNPLDDSLLQDIQHTYGKIRKIIEDIIKEGQQDGSILVEGDSKLTAMSIINMFGTAVKKYSLYQLSGPAIVEIIATEHLESVKQVVLHYMRSPKG